VNNSFATAGRMAFASGAVRADGFCGIAGQRLAGARPQTFALIDLIPQA